MTRMRISLSFVLSVAINFLLFVFILPNITSFTLLDFKPQTLNITIVSQIRTMETKKDTINNAKKIDKREDQSIEDEENDQIIKTLSKYRFSGKKDNRIPSETGIVPILQPYESHRQTNEKNIFDVGRFTKDRGVEFIEKKMEFEELSQEKVISFEELAKIGIPNFTNVLEDLQKDYELKLKTVDNDRVKFLQGDVLVQLDIEKDGKITHIKIIKSPDPILADISIRNILKLRPSPRNSTLKGLRVRIEFERK
ncbi:MAG TPA: hypothetical protein ENF81_10675 [Thermotogaceae bacterium]|nr:hypothetical protein [Thermotogaceae bacterium]